MHLAQFELEIQFCRDTVSSFILSVIIWSRVCPIVTANFFCLNFCLIMFFFLFGGFSYLFSNLYRTFIHRLGPVDPIIVPLDNAHFAPEPEPFDILVALDVPLEPELALDAPLEPQVAPLNVAVAPLDLQGQHMQELLELFDPFFVAVDLCYVTGEE